MSGDPGWQFAVLRFAAHRPAVGRALLQNPNLFLLCLAHVLTMKQRASPWTFISVGVANPFLVSPLKDSRGGWRWSAARSCQATCVFRQNNSHGSLRVWGPLLASAATPAVSRCAAGEERYIPYDVLLGCDGARSAVRAACVMEDREFDASIADIFNRYKSVHVPRPPALDGDLVHVFPGGVPNMNGAALLAPADHVNFVLGYYLNTPPDEELHSSDPAVVAAYLKKHLPVSLDFDAVAEQWVRQPWSTTPKVKCNKYHMANGRVLLMGDAAHATSPSIGMGMNTALADALAFGRLLEVHGANWDALLPAFSQERVKEGHALVELADHAYALSPKWMLVRLLEQVVYPSMTPRTLQTSA